MKIAPRFGGTCTTRPAILESFSRCSSIQLPSTSRKDVIIDTNALKHSNRVQFVDWFPGFSHHLIFISVDHETRMDYLKSRSRKIDEEVITNMEKILETPSSQLDKEWDTVTHIKNIGHDFYAPIHMKGHLDIFSDV